MVQASAAIGGFPILGAIAPPGIDLFIVRHEQPRHVLPVERVDGRLQQFGFHRRVADDVQKLLVTPDVVFQRCHVEVANEHQRIASTMGFRREARFHLAQEVELVRELRIHRRVRNVSARRHIEIVQFEARLELRRNMAGIVLAAKGQRMGFAKRHTREDRDPVVAFLAVDRLMDVAHAFEGTGREKLIGDLCLLQAEHVGLVSS